MALVFIFGVSHNKNINCCAMNELIRTLISVYGYPDHGKTTTINDVIPLIFNHFANAIFFRVTPNFPIQQYANCSDNVNAIIDIDTVRIGVESQGDVSWQVIDSLDDFAAHNCNIILCCTHPQNNCHAKLYVDNEMHTVYGYRTFRMANYSLPANQKGNPQLVSSLNQYSATQIFETILRIINGTL